MRRLASLVILAALSGCDDEDLKDTGDAPPDDETGTPDDTDDSGTAPACADLAPDACATRADCGVIDGRPMHKQDGAWCVDHDEASQPLGCMEAEDGCGDAETIASSPDAPETCWWFSSTCIPTGWTVCEDVGGKYGECVD